MKNFRTTVFLSCLLVTLSAGADIRADLDALLVEDPITEPSVAKVGELGDSTAQQNLQQLCYKTACAGFAYLGATNLYEETMAKVITKSFVESFQAQCPRCRGLGVAMVACPKCDGKRCPSCEETGRVKGRCPDCNGTASLFSPDLALAAYRRGLAALVKATGPQAEPSASQTLPAPRRLSDDQFFNRHCLDLVAYAVYTNRESTTIQKQAQFRKIVARAYVPKGFSQAVLLYRYPNGETFEVANVSMDGYVFYVTLRKKNDPWPKNLIIPTSESSVAAWKKGRTITSRDWVLAAPAYHPLAPSLHGYVSTSTSIIYRSLAEFRQLHPGAEDTETP